jgi:hypothetical protein
MLVASSLVVGAAMEVKRGRDDLLSCRAKVEGGRVAACSATYV